ncbi:ead/Ea22-like family protein [Burkholderia arboris]|uniref:Ead/Ea22-like family protein n=1 Tax=Burkholderia arboris TaxID=488730 RepID=A0ABZ3DLF3_9BURK
MTTENSRAAALTVEHLTTLKQAALAATPQDIDGAERIESRPDGSYITCPACEGEGCLPFESDYCNYDHVAIGVQFYGVGTEPGAAEAYFRAAKPATILALLDRLERAESALPASSIDQLKRFAGLVLKDHRNDGYPGDVDGDALQRYAEQCGLIEERKVDEPCTPCCSCADVGQFPAVCYFNTDLGKAAINAARAGE